MTVYHISIYFNFEKAVHLETSFTAKMKCVIHELFLIIIQRDNIREREEKFEENL